MKLIKLVINELNNKLIRHALSGRDAALASSTAGPTKAIKGINARNI